MRDPTSPTLHRHYAATMRTFADFLAPYGAAFVQPLQAEAAKFEQLAEIAETLPAQRDEP